MQPKTHSMRNEPLFFAPPLLGNMFRDPQDNSPPEDVFPEDPGSHFISGGTLIPLPPPGNMSGAPQNNLL
jgi:hypothetical protein